MAPHFAELSQVCFVNTEPGINPDTAGAAQQNKNMEGVKYMQSVLNHNSAGNINCSYSTVNTIIGLERESAVGRAHDFHTETLILGTIKLLFIENVLGEF